MKKSTKILLFGGLGAMLFGIIIIVVTTVVFGFQIKTFLFQSDLNVWNQYFQKSYEKVEYKKASDDGVLIENARGTIESLKIQIGGGEINILTSTNDDICVKMNSNDEVYYKMVDDTLVMEYGHNCDIDGMDIVLYIPDNMHFERADLELGAGTMYIQELDANVWDVKVGAGTLEVEAGNITKEAKMEVGMGEVDFYGILKGDADIDCGFGNINLSLEEAQEEMYSYNVTCGAGDVVIGDSNYSGVGIDKSINHGGNYQMDMKCGFGEILVSFQ